MGLPQHVRRVCWLRAPESAKGQLYAVVTPHPEQASFDAEVVDASGNLYLQVSGYRTVALPESIDSKLLTALTEHEQNLAAGDQAIMDVYWLEQCIADVPEQDDWLSTSDLVQLNSMRFEKRRLDWRLGRWTAKLALAVHLHLPCHLRALAEIEVRPALSGAPEAYLANKPAEITIHSATATALRFVQ